MEAISPALAKIKIKQNFRRRPTLTSEIPAKLEFLRKTKEI